MKVDVDVISSNDFFLFSYQAMKLSLWESGQRLLSWVVLETSQRRHGDPLAYFRSTPFFIKTPFL